jgi:hydroxyacylglutathione hydrolase
MTAVNSIRLGHTNCFLLRGDEPAVLVDTSTPGTERKLEKAFRQLGVQPGDVRCIVATHCHYDHVGSLKAVREMTRAPVVMHKLDAGVVARGHSPIPPATTAWGKVLRWLLTIAPGAGRYEALGPDVTIDGEMSLEPFGIPARVLPTPGHTPGSLSVLLASGEALVGDLAMNGFPLRIGPGIPTFADSVKQVYASWEKLLAAGATTIYPSHGKPFPANHLRDVLSRRVS